MASGMAEMSKLIEGGMSHRDAVAKMFKENRHVIFTGNGYSSEWPVEAQKRGLPNLHNTPLALATFTSEKAKKLFTDMGILTPEECDAKQEVMYENYCTTLNVEVATLIDMMETAMLPACAQDMAKFTAMPKLAGERQSTYEGIKQETDKLKELFEKKPHDLKKEAEYLCETVKPQMGKVRELVDKAEGLMTRSLYPFPTYEEMVYSHHS